MFPNERAQLRADSDEIVINGMKFVRDAGARSVQRDRQKQSAFVSEMVSGGKNNNEMEL